MLNKVRPPPVTHSKVKQQLVMLNKVKLPPETHSKAKQQLAMLNRVSKPSKAPPSARAPTQPSFLVQLLPPLLLELLLVTRMPELLLVMLEPQSKARVPLQAMLIPRLRILRRRIRCGIDMHEGMRYRGVEME
jgi:hypothetical protein